MADEGAVAVAEAPAVEAAPDTGFVDDAPASGETRQVTQADDKTDGRNQPDSVRKRVAELRRQAEAVTDPTEKQRILDDATKINNALGKNSAYEKVYPTVREAREVKTLVDSFGGREGLATIQTTLDNVRQIDQQLESGDPAVVAKMWQEAPEGMKKIAPLVFAELEKASPEDYAKAVTPHAIKFLDNSGFPEAFDQMVQLYRDGKTAEADQLQARMAQWVQQSRQGKQEEKRTDPEVERLRKELDDRKSGENQQAVDRAYSEVVTHAAPVIDKYLKPIVAKLGLSPDQYTALREDTWKYLQDTRNADPTYKTVANAKYRTGVKEAADYIKGETENRAEDAAKARAKFWYGHQLKNGAPAAKPSPTATPVSAGITRGKEPTAAEIDYSAKGVQLAKKQGFKDLSDMILAGKAPLKTGGIRQWR